jgi:hypothetical protein
MIAPLREARPDGNGAFIWYPGRLWSLLDMLEKWGYFYVHVGLALGYSDLDLTKFVEAGSNAAGLPVQIEVNHPIVSSLESRCDEILKFTKDQELGAVPSHASHIKAKIAAAKRRKDQSLNARELLDEVGRIKNDLFYILSQRPFYSLRPVDVQLYGQPMLLGARVAKKFPKARKDIERAGNCLALGEPTACVLHLNRAMEIATRRLAGKLGVTLDAKDSWGMALGKMTQPIKDMPDSTPSQKRKKEKWSDCRTNLYHVKMAWRDPGAHGTESYDDKEAHDILARVRSFMAQLATLL